MLKIFHNYSTPAFLGDKLLIRFRLYQYLEAFLTFWLYDNEEKTELLYDNLRSVSYEFVKILSGEASARMSLPSYSLKKVKADLMHFFSMETPDKEQETLTMIMAEALDLLELQLTEYMEAGEATLTRHFWDMDRDVGRLISTFEHILTGEIDLDAIRVKSDHFRPYNSQSKS